ncbi:hypothetical protein PchlO6_3591 [Pseudomonas chlororaphis O6]|uniref:Uncharacterized protein n=1 Tax=Pseudomonas chlororaphis O6 TaxID=1037915 RepID=A0AB33WP75_9PSED|nr:hypothetical protein PchlO6_3591 [Pseudomonas chlororaphis O6]
MEVPCFYLFTGLTVFLSMIEGGNETYQLKKPTQLLTPISIVFAINTPRHLQ